MNKRDIEDMRERLRSRSVSDEDSVVLAFIWLATLIMVVVVVGAT